MDFSEDDFLVAWNCAWDLLCMVISDGGLGSVQTAGLQARVIVLGLSHSVGGCERM